MCDKGQGQEKGVKGGRKKAKRRAKEERMQEKRVKEEKAEKEEKEEKVEGERKQQRKMVALETARPHQNLRSDADGHDEMR